MKKLGVYWSVMHRRPQDYEYFLGLQPSVMKIMDGGPPDYQWVRDNLPGSLVIARDHPMSEQHEDMFKDPVGTGKRHAQEWNVHQQRLGFDKGSTLILGINEPRVWDAGVPEALRKYTIAMCDEATVYGLRVGALQLSVGWPANTGEGTPPDWSPYHDVDNAIRHNNGALVVHEYWADQGVQENWGWWCGRVLKCPWQVPIVIGETGIDMGVKKGGLPFDQRGWLGIASPERYAGELADYVSRMSADKRFWGCCVFAADHASHDWYSFDIEPAYQAILATPIPDAPPAETLPPTTPPGEVEPPTTTPAPATNLVHPLPGAVITAHFSVDNGHEGIDLAMPQGTPIRSVSYGVVAWSAYEENGYGWYVRIDHPELPFFTFYAHMAQPGLGAGSIVEAGQHIGLVGSTGNSTGPHLHFETRYKLPGGAYSPYSPLLNGRCCPESILCGYGLKL